MSRHLADLTRTEDLLSLLSVSASVVDVGVRESGRPHHDTTESGIVLMLANESVESRGFKVVFSTGFSASCAEWARLKWFSKSNTKRKNEDETNRNSKEDLGISRRSVGNVGNPIIKVRG